VRISGPSAERLVAALRRGAPAVIGRILDGSVVLDLRTVEPADDERLLGAIRDALESTSTRSNA
jgi:L-seryl-tRNA(Ser) seleniumtransferase